MRIQQWVRAFPLLLVILVTWACTSSMSTSLEGKKCDSQDRCSVGYECDTVHKECVRLGTVPVTCAADEVRCADGTCSRLDRDAKNCGGCGAICSAPRGGTAVCVERACNFVCGELAACGKLCADFQSDPKNCGRCGAECPAPPGAQASCVAGECQLVCPHDSCSNQCTDLESDPANCGECGLACGPGLVCSSKTCKASCDGALTNCAGACLDISSSSINCGACGVACPSPDNATAQCVDSKCDFACNGANFA